MRLVATLLLLLAGASAHAQLPEAPRAPHCGARDEPGMEALMIGRVYRLLTDDFWATERAKSGMAPTSPSAPRGALTDDDACEHLRKALEREVGKDGAELSDRYQLFFYSVGDYYALYAQLEVDRASGVEVHQRHAMRIYTRDERPRLLMTVYM